LVEIILLLTSITNSVSTAVIDTERVSNIPRWNVVTAAHLFPLPETGIPEQGLPALALPGIQMDPSHTGVPRVEEVRAADTDPLGEVHSGQDAACGGGGGGTATEQSRTELLR
jgi:hypothetical protein